ncbi:MAG: lysophospholipid acyltransferase family protein [Bryobacterales bacterium]|nr:lysophospholipid acyltransferase family protein [Bryobacterales bacterium]
MGSLRVVPCAEHVARFYIKLLDLAIPKLRRVAYRNLELALPGLAMADRRRIVDGSFRNLARILVSISRFHRIGKSNVGQYIHYEGFQHFRAAKERGKGVLFATAHLGNWELSAFAHALMAEPMHVVVRPLDNARVDQMVEALRAASGNTIYSKRDFVRGIVRALHRNEAVGILIDQNVALGEGIFINFFDRKACVSTSFAKLANRTGAAMIPGFALWSETERRFVLKFCPPILPTGDDAADTRTIHAQLESVIREHPDQWLWMHRRWKTRPPGEPGLYD